MAFWGIEVKPGKPYIHRYDNESGRLHVSQATLGSGSSTKKSKVQCNVGDKSPIYLCSLLPEKLETCALNLEFEEEDAVTFSIIGPHSVHLSGFFYGKDDRDKVEYDYGSDSYEEDAVGTDSEDEDDFINYDSEDEDEDGDFIDEDLGMYPPSPVRNSGVRIEEIVDDEKPINENGVSKQGKKKKSQTNVSNNNVNSGRQLVVKSGHDVPLLESEDDDGFPVAGSRSRTDIPKSMSKAEESKDDNTDDQAEKMKAETEANKNLKRKANAVDRDGEHAREDDMPHVSSDPTDNMSQNDAKQKKKNKKKKATKESQDTAVADSNNAEQLGMAEMENDQKPSNEKKKEKKKKNKQNKKLEIASNVNTDHRITDENGGTVENEVKQEAKSLQVRSYPNGLVIEELLMGKPDGKRASPGKKVSVRYTGKLKKNGKIFDSNIGKAPFKFRLGIGQVIKGWDVGVNGMRIGDKRRLTIPPAMGYGAKGAGGAIPPNSWLVFDVELVHVN